MRVHFIAIGGSAMHNLAIAMKLKGYQVTGSDDEIFEPSLSRLKNHVFCLAIRVGTQAL
jgi:UDP-N-acetylmuramate: L-alanyl-gamma-D-glutamyl-meso-diaminopimelate ligase